MAEQPLVSLITINYNQASVTAEMLASVAELTYPNLEVIVVDNASDEDPTAALAAYPCHLIRSDVNLGFTGGNNLGMKAARGDYFFLINNDTRLTPDLVTRLIETFKRFPKAGIVCPKVKHFPATDRVQYAGCTQMNHYTGRAFTVGDGEIDQGQHDEYRETFGAHGAAMMVSRELTEHIGMFDDTYFLYYEEWDWSTRARQAGYSIMYNGLATIYHIESVSTGKHSPLKTYFLNRNRLLYIRKNGRLHQRLFYYAYQLLVAAPKAVITYAFSGQWSLLRSYTRALLWHVMPQKFAYRVA